MRAVQISVLISCFFAIEVYSHGMLLDPPNRSSLWRFDSSVKANYQDNQIFCGGYYVHHELNGGNCGVCGDIFTDAHPQENENTGLYGNGKVVKTYKSGSVIDVHVYLSKNHLGTFDFSLCELTNPNAPESGEDCFKPLALADGSPQYLVKDEDKDVYVQLQLPRGQICERCVLRWHYRSGNNWGDCGQGEWVKGCGPQETFRSCADVSIV